MSEKEEITEGLLRAENYNTQFRAVNPNGKYPLCAAIPGSLPLRCERCGGVAIYDKPCPAVPREQRWGPDYPARQPEKGEASG
jgi:hypothetical protein